MTNLALTERQANRFWAKVDKTETCWSWTGNRSARDYGKLKLNNTYQYAHRVAYVGANGPIPEGHVIDHACHNHSCVNPEHLQAVTFKQNSENRSGPMKNSQTGVRGVYPAGTRFRAAVAIGRRPVSLGTFDTVQEAEQAVIAARAQHYTNSLTDKFPAAG